MPPRIPTGCHPPTRGCDKDATLGQPPKKFPAPTALRPPGNTVPPKHHPPATAIPAARKHPLRQPGGLPESSRGSSASDTPGTGPETDRTPAGCQLPAAGWQPSKTGPTVCQNTSVPRRPKARQAAICVAAHQKNQNLRRRRRQETQIFRALVARPASSCQQNNPTIAWRFNARDRLPCPQVPPGRMTQAACLAQGSYFNSTRQASKARWADSTASMETGLWCNIACVRIQYSCHSP